MGILDKLFGKIHNTEETDDEREIREYEEYYTPVSAVTDSTYSEFLVDDVFSIAGRGTVVTGTVQAGTFHVGDRVKVEGNGPVPLETEIVGIEKFRKMCNMASEGENVGMLLKAVDKKQIASGNYIKKL